MFRLRFAAPMLVVGVFFSGLLMGDDKKTDKDPVVVNVRLPQNFSKLGLTAKQKDQVLKIRAKYAIETNKLKEQLAALTKQEKADVENVLTAAQKSRLRELRGGGKDTDAEIDKPSEAKKSDSAKDKSKEIDKPIEAKKK
jgi:hypothetical protein